MNGNMIVNMVMNNLRQRNPNGYNQLNNLLQSGKNPQQILNDLLMNGTISQAQLNQAQQVANGMVNNQPTSQPKRF